MGRRKGSTVKFWTKTEIKYVLKTWKRSTLQETCTKLGREPKAVRAMVIQIRKCGYPITYKRRVGTTNLMIKEVLSEMGLVKRKRD